MENDDFSGMVMTCAALREENARLRRFVDFVNLWCHRISACDDSERLSMIKHHPTAKAALPATRDMGASNG